MKKLEISRLMDEYTDNEFFPQEGETADPAAVKARVLAQAAPASRRAPRKKRLLWAAALAAAMVLLVGAGLPNIVYHLSNGTVTFHQDTTSKYSRIETNGSLIELEDGRLISLLNGERTDITDLVSEDTPYIYDCSDPEEGTTYYVIMGGTPDNCGAFQWIATPDPFTYNEGDPIHEGTEQGVMYSYSYESYWKATLEKGEYYIDQDGQRQISEGREPCVRRSGYLGSGSVTFEYGMADPPAWLLSAMDELDIPYQYISPEDITTIHS